MIKYSTLYKKYIIEKKTKYQLAQYLNCSIDKITAWLNKYNIPIRNTQFKKGNPSWNKNKVNIYTKTALLKMSQAASNRVGILNGNYNNHKLKGRKNPMFGKIPPRYTHKYKETQMRSDYELNFAKWLDCSGIKWQYESKTFNLGNTTYTPDFYLPEFDCYIEIKGTRWGTSFAYYKFLKTQRKYPKIQLEVFNKRTLQSLSVIS